MPWQDEGWLGRIAAMAGRGDNVRLGVCGIAGGLAWQDEGITRLRGDGIAGHGPCLGRMRGGGIQGDSGGGRIAAA